MTGVSVTVAAIYYMFTLRMNMKTQELTLKSQQQNVETRQAQLLLGLSQTWTSGDFLDKYYQINSWKIDNFDDFEKMDNDTVRGKIWFSMFTNWETMGVLVHENLIDIRILARFIGGFYKRQWEKWGPYIKQQREVLNLPRSWVEAEYLYDRLMEFAKQNPDYGINPQ